MSQSRLVKYVSAKQRRANRANAQKSTGPRTAEGKRIVSRNAVAHGIFFKDLLMPGECAEEFDEFVTLLLDDLRPQGYLEMSICEQYVEAKWRIRRVRRAEHHVHEGFADMRPLRHRAMPLLREAEAKFVNRCLGVIDPTAASLPPEPEPVTLAPDEVTAAQTLCESHTHPDGGPSARLARYQRQLELSADRALRQLHKLRAERRAHGDPPESPFIDDHTDERDDPETSSVVASASTCASRESSAQNKPISNATPTSSGDSSVCDDHAGNTARRAAPEIFHPVDIGASRAPRDVVAGATAPPGESKQG